jgi:hypothetical protein
VNGNSYGATIRSDYGGDPLGARTAGTYGTSQADPFGEAGRTGSREGSGRLGRSASQSRLASQGRWPGWGLRPGNAERFGDAAAAYGTRTAEPRIGSARTEAVSVLVFTIVAFKASLTFGVATLLFGDPRSS